MVGYPVSVRPVVFLRSFIMSRAMVRHQIAPYGIEHFTMCVRGAIFLARFPSLDVISSHSMIDRGRILLYLENAPRRGKTYVFFLPPQDIVALSPALIADTLCLDVVRAWCNLSTRSHATIPGVAF